MITVLINPTKFSLAAEATVRKESSIVTAVVTTIISSSSKINCVIKTAKKIILHFAKTFNPVFDNSYSVIIQILSCLYYHSNLLRLG